MKKYTLVSAIVLALAGCHSGQTEDALTKAEPLEETQPAEFMYRGRSIPCDCCFFRPIETHVEHPEWLEEAQVMRERLAEYQEDSTFRLCVDYELSLQLMKPTPAGKRINAALLSEVGRDATPQQCLRNRMQTLRREYAHRQCIGDEVDSISVYLVTDDLIGFQHFSYTWVDGAHASYATRYYHFNARTGQRLKAADLFVQTDELKTLMLTLAKELQAGYPGLTAIEPLDNFILLPDGIAFTYPPDEIAPFGDGQVYLDLPTERITPYLRPGSHLKSCWEQNPLQPPQ